jgi:hypothetical protein
MDMQMVPVMRMPVNVTQSIHMIVRMRMLALPKGPNQPPHQVHQTECSQKPGSQTATETLNVHQLRNRRAGGQPGEAQPDGAQHVPESAQQSNPKRLGTRPFACGGQYGKREIMIRSGHRVNKPDPGRRTYQSN